MIVAVAVAAAVATAAVVAVAVVAVDVAVVVVAAAAAALPYLKLHVCVQYSNQILHMTFKSKAWSVLNLFNLELGNYLSTLFIELKGRIKSHHYPATHFKKIIQHLITCMYHSGEHI